MRECALSARPPCRLHPISTMSWGMEPVSARSTRENRYSNYLHVGYFSSFTRPSTYLSGDTEKEGKLPAAESPLASKCEPLQVLDKAFAVLLWWRMRHPHYPTAIVRRSLGGFRAILPGFKHAQSFPREFPRVLPRDSVLTRNCQKSAGTNS